MSYDTHRRTIRTDVLRNLKIEGFKSIRSQEVTLGRVTILIGQNGAGKSNILEAIGMLSAAAAGNVTYESLNARGVRLSTPEVYKSALRGGERPRYFNLAAEFDDLSYEARLYTGSGAANPAWTFHSESLKSGGFKLAGRSARGVIIGGASLPKGRLKNTESIVAGVELLGDLGENQQAALDSLKEFGIYAPATGVLRGVDTDARVKSPLGLTGGGLVSCISDLLWQGKTKDLLSFFEILPWYKELTFEEPSEKLKNPLFGAASRNVLTFRDQFMRIGSNKLYSYDVSEGALYVCFVLAIMLHEAAPQFFALDNIDTALNPGLIKNLILNLAKLARSQDKQVVLTTHNPATLDALDIFDEENVLYVVDRAANGATELNRIQPPPGMTREDWDRDTGNAKLSELWLDGLLGGLTPPARF